MENNISQQEPVGDEPVEPTKKCLMDWWRAGKGDKHFWEHKDQWSNQEIVNQIQTALRYFISVWQRPTKATPQLTSEVTNEEIEREANKQYNELYPEYLRIRKEKALYLAFRVGKWVQNKIKNHHSPQLTKAKNEWVCASDRLPKLGQNVEIKGLVVRYDWYFKSGYDGDFTHWMPLTKALTQNTY